MLNVVPMSPDNTCIKRHGLDEEVNSILDDLEREPLKVKKIDAPISSFSLSVKKNKKECNSCEKKETLNAVINNGNRRFSKDITHYDAIVFEDGIVVFPNAYDILHILRDSEFSEEFVQKTLDKMKQKHLKMTFIELLSDLGIPMTDIFLKTQLSKILSYISIEINNQEGESIISGMLHKNITHTIKLLNENFPNIKNLTLDKIPGTNFSSTVYEAAFLVRYYQLDTYIKKRSLIYSAGVILFFSGLHNYFEKGAVLTHHGWKARDIQSGDKGSKESTYQKRINEVHSILSFPILLDRITEDLTPDEYHQFTEQELKDLGVVMIPTQSIGKEEQVLKNYRKVHEAIHERHLRSSPPALGAHFP